MTSVSPSREVRCGMTTLLPARHSRTISGISRGGSCRSQSMTTIAWPRGVGQAADRRRRLPEPAREEQQLDPRIAGVLGADELDRAVGARDRRRR